MGEDDGFAVGISVGTAEGLGEGAGDSVGAAVGSVGGRVMFPGCVKFAKLPCRILSTGTPKTFWKVKSTTSVKRLTCFVIMVSSIGSSEEQQRSEDDFVRSLVVSSDLLTAFSGIPTTISPEQN